MYQQNKGALKKAHIVGTSVVVTIDPTLVKDLKIDDMTFFLQRPVEGGIFMEIQRLAPEDKG